MTAANKTLITLSLKAGKFEHAVYLALRNNLESGNMVYLDNAYDDVKSTLTRHQFAGYLSALEKAGTYKKTSDKYFGELVFKKCE